MATRCSIRSAPDPLRFLALLGEPLSRADGCLLFIHPPAHGSEVSPAARNTLDSARIPRASKLLICGLFLKGRVLAQDGEPTPGSRSTRRILVAGRSLSPLRCYDL